MVVEIVVLSEHESVRDVKMVEQIGMAGINPDGVGDTVMNDVLDFGWTEPEVDRHEHLPYELTPKNE